MCIRGLRRGQLLKALFGRLLPFMVITWHRADNSLQLKKYRLTPWRFSCQKMCQAFALDQSEIHIHLLTPQILCHRAPQWSDCWCTIHDSVLCWYPASFQELKGKPLWFWQCGTSEGQHSSSYCSCYWELYSHMTWSHTDPPESLQSGPQLLWPVLVQSLKRGY